MFLFHETFIVRQIGRRLLITRKTSTKSISVWKLASEIHTLTFSTCICSDSDKDGWLSGWLIKRSTPFLLKLIHLGATWFLFFSSASSHTQIFESVVHNQKIASLCSRNINLRRCTWEPTLGAVPS